MSRDLEGQLGEMGPEYRAVVARLRAGREAPTGATRATGEKSSWLIAASFLVVIALAVPSLSRLSRPSRPSSRHPPREYRASVGEMIATQNPDGSWKNDFLTRRNAAALKACGDPAAQVAYRKAVRNLRLRGIL